MPKLAIPTSIALENTGVETRSVASTPPSPLGPTRPRPGSTRVPTRVPTRAFDQGSTRLPMSNSFHTT